ncbi:hypothetical protein VNO80_11507 [Phaseolus coccineus]|uniref:Uncharacterized protein n=1 Tax=Phaseolus coccineus TaxID=3886 RepID=A0AAN9RKI5_PHACN
MQINGEERGTHEEPSKDSLLDWYARDPYAREGLKVPKYIDSSFRSSTTNEVYFFLLDKFVRVYYTPGQERQTDDKFLTDLSWIGYSFPSFRYNLFGAYGIDCAFDTEGNEAYIFYSEMCAYIDYANDKILSGLITIEEMFPVLKDTVFEDGIDSAFRSSRGKEVYLFERNKYCCMDYGSKQLVGPIRNITDGFPVLKGTIFEDGIDASFASHKENQVYLFKGENYAVMNFIPGSTDDTLVDGVKPIIDGWSCFKGILPLENLEAEYSSDE